MARNEEKQLGQLNRLYLQREEEERRKKFPPRPKLHTLRTAAEVAKYLPSIITDIDISIKQSQVTCYTSEASEGYLAAADEYRREYEAFVRKLLLLDPSASASAIPWTDRPYDRKRTASAAHSGQPQQTPPAAEAAAGHVTNAEVSSDTGRKRPKRIESALLLLLLEEQQQHQQRPAAAAALRPALQDAPLQFDAPATGLAAAVAARDSSRSSVGGMAARSRGCCDDRPSLAAETRHACHMLPPGGAGGGSSSADGGGGARLPEQSRPTESLPMLTVEGGSCGDGAASGLARLRQVYADASSSDEGE